MNRIRRATLGLLLGCAAPALAAACDNPTPSNTNSRGPGSSYPTQKKPVVSVPSTNVPAGTGQPSGSGKGP